MKMIRRSHPMPSLVSARPAPLHQTYLFYEKRSGVAHFQVDAEADGRLPVEQAACLLAMHCMARGQSPEDYVVMVEADQSHTEGLLGRAQTLLHAVRSVKSDIKITRREEEVLRGILRGLANKEIANDLNLSERTVKFHVSSLLSKFHVRGRMELVREASRSGNWAIPASAIPPAPEPRSVPAPSRMPRVHPAHAPASGFGVAKLQLSV